MTVRRVGDPIGFWNAASVGIGGLSAKVHVPREVTQITIYIKNGATASTFSLMASHFAGLTSSGNEPDASTPPADASFFPITYTTTALTYALGINATIAFVIPDFSPGWICLSSSAATTPVTAGWEATGE
jgi:hypothetical protein